MLEKTVETYLVDRVRAAGGDAYKFTSPARVSVPDRIVVFPPARIYFVELKRPGGKPTRGQLREHERLRALGCDVRVIDSREAVDAFVREATALRYHAPADDREAVIAEILCKLDGLIKKGPLDEPAHSERNGLTLAFNAVAQLSTENSRADALTNEQIDAIAPKFLILGDGDTEHDSIDWRGFARAILAARAAALPPAPVRPEYDADAVRFGECDHCNKRSHIHPRDGAMICGSCADADYLTAWINHAEQLRAILAASHVEQPAAAPNVGEGSAAEAYASCAGLLTAPSPADERAAFDGDSEETRAAFRAYDQREFVSRRTPWQIWRDACAWYARAASASETGAES